MAARRVVCAAACLTVLLTACGVEVQRRPEPVPPARLPAASPTATAPAVSARGRVWGARDGRLVPVFTELPGTGTASRVRTLLALAELDERVPSALPAGTRLVSVTRSGDTVVLTLSQELRRVADNDLPLALGQLVLTVTERLEVRRVHVRADRVPAVYVDATGRRIARALERSDFAELVEGD